MALYWVWSEPYRAKRTRPHHASAGEVYVGEFSLCFLNQPQQATCSSARPSVSSGSQTHSPSHVLLTEDDTYLDEISLQVYLSAVCSSLFAFSWAGICTSSYIFPSDLLYSQRTWQPCRVHSRHRHFPFVNVPHAARTKLALELVWREQKRLCDTAPRWIS